MVQLAACEPHVVCEGLISSPWASAQPLLPTFALVSSAARVSRFPLPPSASFSFSYPRGWCSVAQPAMLGNTGHLRCAAQWGACGQRAESMVGAAAHEVYCMGGLWLLPVQIVQHEDPTGLAPGACGLQPLSSWTALKLVMNYSTVSTELLVKLQTFLRNVNVKNVHDYGLEALPRLGGT